MAVAPQGDLGGGVFYGWWIVAACLWILTIGIGGTGYTFGVFFNPLVAEFGWSRAELSVANSMSFLISGLMAPLAGQWTDRFGPRWVVAVGGLVSGGAFALLSLTQSLPQFYATYLVFSLGLAGITLVPLNTMVTRWFERRQGLALGVIATGIGLGGVVLIPVTSLLIAALGWRLGYLVLGLSMLVTVMPLSWFVLKGRPQDMGLLPDGDPPEETAPPTMASPTHSTEVSPGQALRRSTFWLIVASYSLYSVGLMAMLAHTIPYFTDRGLSPATAAAILSAVAGMGMVGKVVVGFLADRFPARWLAVGCFLLQAAAFAVLFVAQNEPLGFAFAVLFGFSLGGLLPLQTVLLVAHFGLSAFGTIYGLFMLLITVGGALGPIITGYVFDVTGSYLSIAIAYLGLNVVAAGLFLLLRQPRPKVV